MTWVFDLLFLVPLLWFYFVIRITKPGPWLGSLLYAIGCIFVNWFIVFLVLYLFTLHSPSYIYGGTPFTGLIILLYQAAVCSIVDMTILKSWNLQAFFLLLVSNIPAGIVSLIFSI
jgi:hypothetical protein